MAPVSKSLVGNGLPQPKHTVPRLNLNIPGRREMCFRSLAEPERNLGEVGAWIDAKIVFQFLAVAIEVQGNPAIEPAIANVGIEGNVANPPCRIASQEVVA